MLNLYVIDVQKPRFVLSDNGTQFPALNWSKKLSAEDITARFTSKYNPQGNPCERVMRELGRLFRSYCNDCHTKWADSLPTIQFLLNVTTRSSTDMTPFELQFGDLVYIKIHKLSSKINRKIKKFFNLYDGPHKIHAKVGENSFLTEHCESKLVSGPHNTRNLKHYNKD
ncbi:hypothetical protein B566_EDAN013828 [Ephemera danica]|nr:hypothetical protein B566_EDAN013828 [Ephemera danica]